MPRHHVSELEGAVLSLLWSKGPTTPYAVRTEFLRSLNPHWSGSAGAIYPLMRRLEQRAWVRAARAAGDERGTRQYRLTPSGLRAFRRWFGPPVGVEVAGVPPDPLRTRIEFLRALPAGQQRVFLTEAADEVRHQLQRVTQECRALATRPRSMEYWATVGARDMLASRLAWIGRVRRAVLGTR